jgi:hypothetical protein
MTKNNSQPTTPPPQQVESRALTIPQLAQYLNMKNWHAEELLRKGNIPFRWIGKRKIVDRKDADAYFDALPYAEQTKRRGLQQLSDVQLQRLFTMNNEKEKEAYLAMLQHAGIKVSPIGRWS